jgi:hypothetical protein
VVTRSGAIPVTNKIALVQMQTGGLQSQARVCTAFIPVTGPARLSRPSEALFLYLSVPQRLLGGLSDLSFVSVDQVVRSGATQVIPTVETP